ncbi:aspartate/glutamate racemase family protein [Geosporobacter ferrireducens]|uniref:aspartate/glutamate racemase family protein n=1 Tax=Geosporobacter ferrireducens TaxID=1424294 RepID=UPI00139CF90E|nr:amino acid racemase [Geosporobacter ferrireducens]MTI57903.1 amino acid racemase [Geosporobacter ferrireducens]
MEQPMIGILAGMGPRSTSPFLELVLDQCQVQYNAKHDMDYPHIMIYSLPTPFYIDREIDHSRMKDTIIEGLRKLESTGVRIIAMPCNSAHVYYKELKKAISIPLLDIIEETVKCLPNTKQRITVFATETTIKSGLYQKGIISAGHEFIFLEAWQPKINSIITSIKMKKDRDSINSSWKELINEVKGKCVDGIVIACTDLSILSSLNQGLNMYDSSEALAKSLVERYIENK